jgi:hypothetical protein
MRVRRGLASVAMGGIVLSGALLAVAPSVSAATTVINGCQTVTIGTDVGDVTILVFDPAECGYSGFTILSGSITLGGEYEVDGDLCRNVVTNSKVASSYVYSNTGAITFSTAPAGTGDPEMATCGDPVPVASSAGAPPIPAWVQAYGRASADAKCLDGWDQSWQSWAEKVTGGWVCTRNIPSLG